MSHTLQTETASRECPLCGAEYVARVRPRQDQRVGLATMYRHEYRGWVYYHDDLEVPEWY